VFGGITVVSGLVGTFLGGWLGDWLQRYTKRSYLLVSGWGMVLAAPVTYLALTAQGRPMFLSAMFVAQVLVFLNTGPANAVLVNTALPEVRATAIAMSIFVYHLLGDVPSPILMGMVSDATGSLENGLQLATGAMVVSGLLYLWGARTLPEDTERVQQIVAERERGQ
jgi:nitrate/nitrite transporter NarK